MRTDLSLLDVLAQRMNCTYLSDLRFLSVCRRGQLARKIENIPVEAASVSEWNDALRYLTGRTPAPEQTAEESRNRLIALLQRDEEKGE